MPDTIERFATYYHGFNNISPPRRRRQVTELRALELYIGSIEDLDAPRLRDYLASLVEGGNGPTTVGFKLGLIGPFVTWAWENKIIEPDRYMELRQVKPPRGANGNGRPRPYDRQQIRRFWREYDETYPAGDVMWLDRYERGQSIWGTNKAQRYCKRVQMDAIVGLALYGGLRLGEIYGLQLPDMHPDGEYVSVKGAAKNPQAENRDRAVPWLSPDMRTAVADWLALRGRLQPPHLRPWLSLHGEEHRLRPMPERTFRMLMRTTGKGWEFHRMRHTMATEALRAGMPIHMLQRILGHSKIDMTLRYAELLPGDVVKAAARVSADFSRAVGR